MDYIVCPDNVVRKGVQISAWNGDAFGKLAFEIDGRTVFVDRKDVFSESEPAIREAMRRLFAQDAEEERKRKGRGG